MRQLVNMLRRLETADRNLEKTGGKAIKDNEKFILSTLKHDQLGEGEDSYGRIVGEYAPKTEEYWSKVPPKPRTYKRTGSPYNFEWTGKFFDGMEIVVNENKYEIESPKKNYLEGIYATQLTELNDSNEEIVNMKIVRPKLYESIFSAITK